MTQEEKELIERIEALEKRLKEIDIVLEELEHRRARTITTESGRKHYNPSMKFLPDAVKEAVINEEIPVVMTVSRRNRESNSEYIVYTWEKELELLTEDEIKSNKPYAQEKLIREKKAQMRKAGDYSYINKGLFRRVADNYGTPLETKDQKGNPYFVYKAINAWGDSFRANEFWATDHKSVLENGFMKVEDVDNNVIISKFLDGSKVKTSASATAPSGKTVNIYAGTGENADLSNFAVRPFTIGGDEYQSVEQYFQYQKWNYLKEDITEAGFREDQKIADAIMNTSNGATLKSLGRKFKNLDTQSWDRNASKEMKIALRASFEQNPKALERLLATGNATLTHTQDNTRWGKEFPKLLMEVRKELSTEKKDPFTC